VALLAEVEAGEEIIIARGNKPVAKLIALGGAGPRELGFVEYELPNSFFEDLPEEELATWEG